MLMQVLRNNVLIEQTLTKKIDSKIILSDKVSEKEEENVYSASYVVLDVGPQVQDIMSGDIPYISSWNDPINTINISGKVGDKTIVRHLFYNEEAIVGVKSKDEI